MNMTLEDGEKKLLKFTLSHGRLQTGSAISSEVPHMLWEYFISPLSDFSSWHTSKEWIKFFHTLFQMLRFLHTWIYWQVFSSFSNIVNIWLQKNSDREFLNINFLLFSWALGNIHNFLIPWKYWWVLFTKRPGDFIF